MNKPSEGVELDTGCCWLCHSCAYRYTENIKGQGHVFYITKEFAIKAFVFFGKIFEQGKEL